MLIGYARKPPPRTVADLIEDADTPMARVRKCPFCKFIIVIRKGQRGVGRGFGMREGNKARGQVIQHIKREHPIETRAALEAGKRRAESCS